MRLGCARVDYVKKLAFMLSDTSATDDLKLCALSDRKQQNANFTNGLKFASLGSLTAVSRQGRSGTVCESSIHFLSLLSPHPSCVCVS